MFENKKIFFSIATLSALLSILPLTSPTHAAEAGKTSDILGMNDSDALLIKIQDIKPIKNEQGITTSCEFLTTLYNHTASDLAELSFNMTWTDNAIESAIEASKHVDLQGHDASDNFQDPTITTQFNFPIIRQMSQKTMKTKIDTNRCFILLEEPEIKVSNCKKDNKNQATSCQAIFKYVSSQVPEYYTDFLEVSQKESQEEENDSLKKLSKDINDTFKKIENDLKETENILKTTTNTSNSSTTEASSQTDKKNPFKPKK